MPSGSRRRTEGVFGWPALSEAGFCFTKREKERIASSMEDVLERMLAVDRQGEALVKQAEEEAQRIREESARALAESSGTASRALAEECAALEAGILESAQKERAAALAKSEAELPRRGAAFSKELEAHRRTLLRELMAL